MSGSFIKIRLFGESFYIHSLKLENQYLQRFQQVAKQLKEPLEEALLNIFFFKKLNLKQYQSIESCKDVTFGGLINNSKSRIEIWKGRKCLQKISLKDMLHPNTLFPLLNVTKDSLELQLNGRMFLIEKEVGLIGEYIIEDEKFDINLLEFSISDISYLKEHHQILLAINYNSNRIESQKSDVLITYQYCVNHLKPSN